MNKSCDKHPLPVDNGCCWCIGRPFVLYQIPGRQTLSGTRGRSCLITKLSWWRHFGRGSTAHSLAILSRLIRQTGRVKVHVTRLTDKVFLCSFDSERASNKSHVFSGCAAGTLGKPISKTMQRTWMPSSTLWHQTWWPGRLSQAQCWTSASPWGTPPTG